jgi:hypothetical protein
MTALEIFHLTSRELSMDTRKQCGCKVNYPAAELRGITKAALLRGPG